MKEKRDWELSLLMFSFHYSVWITYISTASSTTLCLMPAPPHCRSVWKVILICSKMTWILDFPKPSIPARYACLRGYSYNFFFILSFLFLCRSLKFDMLRLKGYFKGWQTCVSSTLTSSTLFCWHIASSLTALPSLRLSRRCFSSQSLQIREIVRAMGRYLTVLHYFCKYTPLAYFLFCFCFHYHYRDFVFQVT